MFDYFGDYFDQFGGIPLLVIGFFMPSEIGKAKAKASRESSPRQVDMLKTSQHPELSQSQFEISLR